MEPDITTLEAPAASPEQGNAQPTAPDSKPEAGAEKEASGEKAQPDKAGSIDTPANRETLRQILKREKEDPNVQFTDAELDLYDAYTAGKLKPTKKQATPKPKASSSPDETGDPEPKANEADGEDADETGKSDDEPDETEDADKDKAGKPDPVLEALMKEVGAKKPEEILNKVKDLRKTLGGRDSQKVAQLERQVQNEQALWQDVAKGVPAAIEHAQRAYGIKLAQPSNGNGGQPSQAAQGYGGQNQNANQGGGSGQRTYIPEEAFIDPDSAKMVNDILRQRDAELDEMRAAAREFKEEREKVRRDSSIQTAKGKVIDEMVTVAQRIDSLKAVPNLREAIANWYDNGKPDSRLEVFNELFELAQEHGTTLTAAATLKRGMDADRLIEQAKEEGRRAAYGHKPNPSLSGSAGGRNEQGNYSPLTDAQIEAMEGDHTLHPPDWYDENDNPVQSKIPKKAWRIFGFA